MITAIQAVQASGFLQLKTGSFSCRPLKFALATTPWSMMKSAHVSTPGASLMEFIIVRIVGDPTAQVDVLIDGQKHGNAKTGDLVTLGTPGTVFVSVDRPTAQQLELVVRNTTARHPMDVDIVAPRPLTSPG